MKEFTRTRMREINDQVAKDEQLWERRLHDKEKEKEEVLHKYEVAKTKLQEWVEKYSTLQERVRSRFILIFCKNLRLIFSPSRIYV